MDNKPLLYKKVAIDRVLLEYPLEFVYSCLCSHDSVEFHKYEYCEIENIHILG